MALQSVTLQPDPPHWAASLQARTLTDLQRTCRQQLGLPTDRPIVLSGHQAAIWHSGILCKWFAAGAMARSANAHAAWVVVDQDAEDFTVIRVPARDAADRLVEHRWQIAPAAVAAQIATDTPACGLAPFAPSPLTLPAGIRPANESITTGVHAILESLRSACTGAASAADQLARATATLIKPFAPTLPFVFASTLARTELFTTILDRIAADPLRCVETYNSARWTQPDQSGLTPLRVPKTPSELGVELPLWTLEPGTNIRKRVWSAQLASLRANNAPLLPRALLLTGLLRWGACDLFIHGLGGAGPDGRSGYDAVTAAWFREWLNVALAPTALATATLTLDLLPGPRITEADLRRAQWLAHAAPHNPALLNDPAAATLKREFVLKIAAASSGSDRRDLYLHMHRALKDHRDQHTNQLAALTLAAAVARRRAGDIRLADDRTWAFPLAAAADIGSLRDRVAGGLTA